MTSTLTQQWLRQVAQPYPSKDRVYADVDAVLASYATLRPKTEVYTFNDGRTQLLICVHGLLPISYRGATYNIPVAIWITYGYQREPPLAYVVPTSDMFVRASKAVDPSGQCDIEYLRNWQRKSEGCSLIGLVQALQDQFSREPPVYAKPRTATPAAVASSITPSAAPAGQPSRPPPPLPGSHSLPVTAVSTPTPPAGLDNRPALPAKPHSHSPSPSVSSPRHSSQPSLGTRPAPPLPTGSHRPQPESGHAHDAPPVPRPPRADPNSRPTSAYASIPHVHDTRPNGYAAPAPPGHPALAGPSTQPQPPYYTPGPIAPQTSGQSQQWQQPPASPAANSHWGHSPQSPPVYVSTRPASVHVSTFSHHAPPPMLSSPPPPQHAPQPVATIHPPAAAPIPDLLDDDAPGLAPSSAPAPPRPPNPELVRLHAAVHQKIHGELASLAAAANADAERMRATQADLLAGEPAIRDEMARLEAVKDVCRTVASRLRDTVNHAEANVAELRRKGDPEVDELICSTTIVHNQLINLVAEDNAIEDTIYHLHRALNAGRIDLDKFLKTTRVLAEEQFTKRVLIERILAGLQANTSHSWT
ncbi:UEV-domain-containing protein [Auricularia subglabra TFB-10046 SS5]|nr:UEV-domain-containing protein [Auricularia subglabra TFB-10046 SS5]